MRSKWFVISTAGAEVLADGPETTHIVVFGQVVSPSTIKLRVARITPHPPPRPIPNRVPRPDDPTPRRPPFAFGRTRAGAGLLKRTASSSSSALALRLGPEEGVAAKKKKLVNGSKDQSKAAAGDKVFKVPPLPGKTNGKGKEKDDVFGPRTLSKKASNGDVGGKGKDTEETEVERVNKIVCILSPSSAIV